MTSLVRRPSDHAAVSVSDPTERAFLRQLGKNVRLQRVNRDLSQEQLAQAARLSRNFVSSIERGTHGIDIVRLVRLAMALGVGLSDLLPDLADLTKQPAAKPTARPWPPAWFGSVSGSRPDLAARSEELFGE
jgi:transcriptional regulator with XRE-family HTH domain